MVILAYRVNIVPYNNLWTDHTEANHSSVFSGKFLMLCLGGEVKYLVKTVKVFFLNDIKLYDYKTNRNILFFLILRALYRLFLELPHKMV